MKKISFISILLVTIWSCQSQKKGNSNIVVGGPCEGCEAIFEYENKNLYNVDTLPNFKVINPKLKITGTIYKKDAKTPAENVILYIYHTNRKGIYQKNGNEKRWAKRHGFIRGWIKTGKDGKYTFYSFRPAAYPNGHEPEHIHMTVKESGKNEYYIDDIMFSDDPMLTNSKKKGLKERCDSGIVSPKMENNILTINRDIILGLNIPNYD